MPGTGTGQRSVPLNGLAVLGLWKSLRNIVLINVHFFIRVFDLDFTVFFLNIFTIKYLMHTKIYDI